MTFLLTSIVVIKINIIKKCQKKDIIEFENSTENSDPVVSVCVQTYQHVNYIKKCLDGILMQKTEFKFEIILGEDDSKDGTRDICIDYAKKYSDKIRLFLHDRQNVIYINGLATGRFNFLHNISKARGKYIATCEGDDYWTNPNKLQKQVDFLEAHPDFTMCSHAVKTVFEGVEAKDPFVKPLKAYTFEDIILHGHFIPTLSVVFRKDALPEIPVWFKGLLVGDIPLVLLVTHYGKNYYMDEILAIKRKHKGGITQQSQRKTKKFKEYSIKNKLFFYKKLNEFFKYEHKKVLNPIIAKHHLMVMYINFKNRKYAACIVNLFKSLYYSPKIFFQKLYKTDNP